MKERIEKLNEWFGMWDINSNVNYTQQHIGFIENYDKNKYKVYIEKYDEENDDYVYSNYCEIINKKEIEKEIKRTFYYINNELWCDKGEYYNLYTKIENMINWQESEKGF